MSTQDLGSAHNDHERLLDVVERAEAASDPRLRRLQLDRAALRAALATDLAEKVPARHAARLNAAVGEELERGALAALTLGRDLNDRPPVWNPTLPARGNRFSLAGLRSSKFVAAAAMLVLGAGLLVFALQRPMTRQTRLASGGPRELPEWAILPPPKEQVAAPEPIVLAAIPTPASVVEVRLTRDENLALAWAKRGMLAVRIVTDSPTRDRERVEKLIASGASREHWTLAAAAPSAIAAVSENAWPINTTIADADAGGYSRSSHPAKATVGTCGLLIRPTAATLAAARDGIERSLAGEVVFERIDTGTGFGDWQEREPEPASAADVVWWRKPAAEWSPRLRVPVLLEFGTPADRR
ncbi:MAG: hypothetical protein JNM86_09235 [Phycisphaerae bacterium]|nr:hypothetical protein [Phycisphaerae bacterium]